MHQSPAPPPRLVLRAWLQSRQPPGTSEPWPAPGPRKPRPVALRLHARAHTYGHCRVCTGHACAVTGAGGQPLGSQNSDRLVQTRFPKMAPACACVRRGAPPPRPPPPKQVQQTLCGFQKELSILWWLLLPLGPGSLEKCTKSPTS